MFSKLGLSMAGKKDEDVTSLLTLAVTLGEIKAAQTIMMDLIGKGATKDQIIAVEKDMDGIGKLIRDNHSDHDTRLLDHARRLGMVDTALAVLNKEQSTHGTMLGRVLDAAFKIIVALALLGLGVKQAGVL